MPKEQKTFTREFKLEAVHLVQKSGKSQAQITRDLGIADSTLHHWCKELPKLGKKRFQAVGIPLLGRKNCVVSGENWRSQCQMHH